MRRTCWTTVAAVVAASMAMPGCLSCWLPENQGTKAVPATPTGVAVSTGDIREAVLTWDHAPRQRGSVRIERSTRETGPFCRVGCVDAATGRFVDSGSLRDATAYYYRLVGVAPCACDSPPSAVVRTQTAPPPSPPTSLAAAKADGGRVRLTWLASPSEGVLRYRVERAGPEPPDAWTVRGNVACCEFADEGDRNARPATVTRYRYRVSAVNRAGATGEPSAPVAVDVP